MSSPHPDTTAAIDQLCQRLRLGHVDRPQFLQDCMRQVGAAVGCSRAGLWTFFDGPAGPALRCLVMVDCALQRVDQVADRVVEDSAAYFTCLREIGYVMAPDVDEHPATRPFYEHGLQPQGVTSLMATAFSLNGRLFGALTCSQVGRRMDWTHRQRAIATRIGSRAALALASVSSNQLQTLFGTI